MKKIINFIKNLFHIHRPIKGSSMNYSCDAGGGWYEFKCNCGKQITKTTT
jgi:hypothetical protein